MATVQKPAFNSTRLPGGETAGDKRIFVNPKNVTSLHIAEEADGGQVVITEIGTAPVGTKEIYTQHRMCGDFYCFIHGNKQVAAIGDTLKEAFQNAARLAA